MKRIKSLWTLLLAAVAVFVSGGLASCNNDVEWDANPILFSVYVLDSEGNNILDVENPNHLVGKLNCVFTYKDISHQIFWRMPPGDQNPWLPYYFTRYYLATFYGAWYESNHVKGHIEIGEFPGDEKWTEHFTLDFPEYNAKFDFELKHKNLGKTTLKVNGKKVKVKNDVLPQCSIKLP